MHPGMQTGTIFDIKEFAVHDGPGIRTTVFLKGCPLKCMWCHNPEGINPAPQIMHSAVGDRTVGQMITASELAALLNGQSEILKENDGGVTFSGGEPLMQSEFLLDVISRLDGLHVLLDTSGFAGVKTFMSVAAKTDLVHYDVKLMDPALHRKYTTRDNGPTLKNLEHLSDAGVPYIVRVPLVPGVTDTSENLTAIADMVENLHGMLRVELLPYNRAAGGKYKACGMSFQAEYDESVPVNDDTDVFEERGIPVRIA